MSDSFFVDLLPFWAIEIMFSPVFEVIVGGALVFMLCAFYAMAGDPEKGFAKNLSATMPAFALLMSIGIGGTLFTHYVLPGHNDKDRRLDELRNSSQAGKVVEINGTKYVPLEQ